MQHFIFYFLIIALVTVDSGSLFAQVNDKPKEENSRISKVDKLDSLFWKHYYSNHEKAYEFVKEGLKISKEENYQEGIVEHKNNKGLYLLRENIYDSAFVYIYDSYELAKEIDYMRGLASSLNNLGIIYRYRGVNDRAIEVYLESLKILQKIDGKKRNIASVKNNIGAILSLEGNQEKALDYYLKALDDYKEVDDKMLIASTLSNVGGVYANEIKFDTALNYYKKADSIYRTIGYPKGCSEVYLNMADVFIQQGEYDKAIDYSKESLEINQELEDLLYVGKNYLNLGDAFQQKGELEKALGYLKDALNVCKKTNVLVFHSETLELLSKVYAKLGLYRKAYQHHRKFQRLNDSLINKTKDNKIVQLEMQYKLDKKLKINELKNKREEKLHQVEMKKQRILTYSALALAFMAFIFAIIIYRALQSKKYVNRLLKEQKREILNKNEELRQYQEEILAQRDEIHKQKQLATNQRDEISRKNDEILSSIEYARHIQTALLPPQTFFQDLLPAYFIFYKPKDIVSGDFYWIRQKNNKIYVAVADCTGHGVPGAFMSLLGLTLLNEVANEVDSEKSPGKFLNILREKLINSMHQRDKSNARDGIEIALCIFDFENMKVHYSGAYNPLYIIRDNNLIETKADRMAICNNPNKRKDFTSHEISLQKGDVAYLFTDGFVDQVNETTHKKYRKDRFKETLLSINQEEMHVQRAKLEKSLLQWKGNYEQIDDILILGIGV